MTEFSLDGVHNAHQSIFLERVQRLFSALLSAPSVPPPPPLPTPVSASVARMGVERLSGEKSGEAGASVCETGLSGLPPLT